MLRETYPLSLNNPGRVEVNGVFFENSRTRTSDILDGTSQTICISETNGFVLTAGNDNATNGPELTDYATQCHQPGLLLQQTRGSRWLYGAPGHSM